MAKIIQNFRTIAEFSALHHVILPKPYCWRLLPFVLIGEVQGLPTSRGRAVATNGILLAIEQQENIFIGHIDSFIMDEQESFKTVVRGESKKTKKDRVPDLTDYLV